MNRGLILLLPFIFLFFLSCGDDNEGFNYVYLKLGNYEYLYLYNQRQNYLCVDKESEFCNTQFNRYYARNDSSYDYEDYDDTEDESRYMFLDANQSFAIKQRYTQSSSTIFFLMGKNELLRYSESYYPSPRQYTYYDISPIQTPSLCDISGAIQFIMSIIQSSTGISEFVQIDLSKTQLNPELCKASDFINCLIKSQIFMKSTKSIETDEIGVNMVLNCISPIYSMERFD